MEKLTQCRILALISCVCSFLLIISSTSAYREIVIASLYLKSTYANQQVTNWSINPDLVYRAGADVYDYIKEIRRDCGELCDTSRPGRPGPYFQHVTSSVNCKALFMNPYIDLGRFNHSQPAPKNIPQELLNYYTMNGRINISPYYFDTRYMDAAALSPVWTYETIEQQIQLAREGKLGGTYGVAETNELREGLKHTPGVKGGRVLVIGSEIPWVEVCALEAGAKDVVTLEYGKIKSLHPSIKTMVPWDFRMNYLNGTLGLFDAVITFSSVEHSGLGRYGDALNPWGDIITIARAWCVTKSNGGLALGVMFDATTDRIDFNAHRVYSSVRYPYLTTNWKQLYQGNGYQKVHVFSKSG